MFNPFKRKSKEFKLDDITLPSLNDNLMEKDSNNELPNLNDITSSKTNIGSSSDQMMENNQENSFKNSNPILDNLSTNNSFNAIANTTPTFSSNLNSVEGNSIHNDILISKLDALDSRVSLTDVKLNAIERKIDLIYRILMEEVSLETKQKIQMEDMINSAKNKS